METALLKIFSDILDAADSAQVTLLGLLDLSAAYDTVDNDILLTRLQKSYVRCRWNITCMDFIIHPRSTAISHFQRPSIRTDSAEIRRRPN